MTIRIEDLSKSYHGVDVLSHVNLEISTGSVVGLHGVNGSGKTMLMRAICGLIRPTSGHVYIDGVEVRAGDSYPKRLGMLIEGPAFLPGYTALDNLLLLASIRGAADESHLRELITLVGLDPEDKRKYRKFSLGMKQRLGIAAAIMEDPDIVVLDEPTNALDSSGVAMVKKVVESLRNRGATVVLACHDFAVLKGLSDQIVHIAEGKIDEGFELPGDAEGGWDHAC
ncbi:MAG: ATP-binding cassette domain-containing protein [Coriobacteriaceae bacterium]|nr:ATP-binding cassette domain-containing protein [Coriobacteriaceae bacterium]